MKIKYIILLSVLMITLGCTNTSKTGSQNATTKSAKSSNKIAYYTCSMHHQIHKEEPGKCPICGMKLVPVSKSELQSQDSSKMQQKEMDSANLDSKIAYYTCSMHHQIHRGKPEKCPICGMKLVPVMKSEQQFQNTSKRQSSVKLKLSPHQQFMAGVKLSTAEKTSFSPQLILTGKTIINPQKTQTISAWFSGWIEKSYIRNPGEKIAIGQKLYEIYSPQLLAIEKDYLVAVQQKTLFQKANVDLSKTVKALRQKLSLWGLSEAQINNITKKSPTGKITIYSKQSGYLVQKLKEEGDYVAKGGAVFKLADNNKLWVQAQLYDSKLAFLRGNPEVYVKIDGFPGEKIRGEIVFQNPVNQSNSRVHLLYISIPNPKGKTQPGMLAYVYLNAPAKKPLLTIPQSAIVYGDDMNYVWTALSNNTFETKMVKLGKVNENKVAILKGLKPGAKIVSSGVYLVNSAYRLKTGGVNMSGMQMSDMKMSGKSE